MTDSLDTKQMMDAENSNPSNNPTFESILNTRLSRRRVLGGSAASAATVLLGTIGLAACSDEGSRATAVSAGDAPAPAPAAAPVPAPSEKLLGFDAVGKNLLDGVTVPAGYTASVIYALGDPLKLAAPARQRGARC